MHLNDTGYSGQIYSPGGLRKHAQFVKRTLTKLAGQFDFVAVTGKSGLSVAFAALALGAEFDLVTIRKGESSHGSLIEGRASGTRYVVIDDFISYGETMNRIAEKLRTHSPEVTQVAALLYAPVSRGETFKLVGQDADVRIYGDWE